MNMLKKFLWVVIFSTMFVSSGFSEETLQHATGYVKPPIDFSHIGRSTPEEERYFKDKASFFPVSYDLRKLNRVNKTVGNQNPYGTCWAFSALGAMESNYMTQGLTSLGSKPDLSELHLAWFAYKDPAKGHSFTICKDRGVILSQSGHYLTVSALLSRMSSPVIEKSMPYSKAGTNAKKSDSVMTKYVGNKTPSDYFPLALNLKDCIVIGSVSDDNREKQKENIKKMLSVYGAVSCAIYTTENFDKLQGKKSAYFDNSKQEGFAHNVLIIGWNDNYSRKNFATKKPKQNGAWIVKNSYGSDWGNNGYFYMSYEQFIADASVYIVGEPKTNEKVYYHDALGMCKDFGYGKNTPAYAANVFKATATEGISSVGIYATDDNAKYEIYICSDLGTKKPSSPVSGDAKRVASGTFVNAGYHNVELYNHVLVKKNRYFSVIVKMTTPQYDKPIAVERVEKDYSDGAVINSKESYFSSDMKTWTDGTKIKNDKNKVAKSNACIKVFTLPAVAINKTNFPDENFREYVSYYPDRDRNTYLTADEINKATYINVSNGGISNLKGIEYFTALKSLLCDRNQLTKLDLSKYTALEYLQCGSNKLTKLDVSKCTALEYLKCGYNQLTKLDVSKCTALQELECHNNQLTKLDVSKCTSLQKLFCPYNQLTTLTLGNNTALESLECSHNQLAKLNVSKCTALEWLFCGDNQLTTLTFGNNTVLKTLQCGSNKLTKLDVSKCTALQQLQFSHNQLTKLDVSKCTALEWLDCSYNQLAKLDVSKCTALEFFFCYDNKLTKLDVSKCTALQRLFCYDNKLTNLKLGKHEHFVWLECQNNKLKKIDLSGCPNIYRYYFRCDEGVEIIWPPNPKLYSTQNETHNGHSDIQLKPATLKISSDDILWQGSDRDEDFVKVKANSPVKFIIGDWLKPDGTVENISPDNIQIFVDDKFVESIKISDEKIFTLPADFVHDDFRVGVKAKIYGNEFESDELYISAED